MPGKNNGRVAKRARVSFNQAKREYDEAVERGSNAVYEHVADREFARADAIAQQQPGVLVSDRWYPGVDGLGIREMARRAGQQ